MQLCRGYANDSTYALGLSNRKQVYRFLESKFYMLYQNYDMSYSQSGVISCLSYLLSTVFSSDGLLDGEGVNPSFR